MRPTWRLSQRIREIALECEETEQHCLIVFYYAGHGEIIDGGLNFVFSVLNILVLVHSFAQRTGW